MSFIELLIFINAPSDTPLDHFWASEPLELTVQGLCRHSLALAARFKGVPTPTPEAVRAALLDGALQLYHINPAALTPEQLDALIVAGRIPRPDAKANAPKKTSGMRI